MKKKYLLLFICSNEIIFFYLNSKTAEIIADDEMNLKITEQMSDQEKENLKNFKVILKHFNLILCLKIIMSYFQGRLSRVVLFSEIINW